MLLQSNFKLADSEQNSLDDLILGKFENQSILLRVMLFSTFEKSAKQTRHDYQSFDFMHCECFTSMPLHYIVGIPSRQ